MKEYVSIEGIGTEDFCVGDWVIVKYEDKEYPGKEPCDKILYPFKMIVGKIRPPEPVGMGTKLQLRKPKP